MNDTQEPADRWRAQRASIGEGFDVARALPRRGRRNVGPWCLLDHFGPVELATTGGMRVGAPADAPTRLHGVQLWTALPTLSPPIDPGFEHHRDLPTREGEGAFVCVFVGELMELRSPATRWEGAEVRLEAGAQCELELAVHDEHALFVLIPIGGAPRTEPLHM